MSEFTERRVDFGSDHNMGGDIYVWVQAEAVYEQICKGLVPAEPRKSCINDGMIWLLMKELSH